jgi:hypothetical protein
LNLTDVWSALDNDLRPAITCLITIALDPFEPIPVEVVQAREIRTFQKDRAPGRNGQPGGETWPPFHRDLHNVNGTIKSEQPLEDLRLILIGLGTKSASPAPAAAPSPTAAQLTQNKRQLERFGFNVPVIANETATQFDFELNELPVGQFHLALSVAGWSEVMVYEFAVPVDEQPEQSSLHLALTLESTPRPRYQVSGTLKGGDNLKGHRLLLSGWGLPRAREVETFTKSAKSGSFSFEAPSGDYVLLLKNENNEDVASFDVVVPPGDTAGRRQASPASKRRYNATNN